MMVKSNSSRKDTKFFYCLEKRVGNRWIKVNENLEYDPERVHQSPYIPKACLYNQNRKELLRVIELETILVKDISDEYNFYVVELYPRPGVEVFDGSKSIAKRKKRNGIDNLIRRYYNLIDHYKFYAIINEKEIQRNKTRIKK